LIIIHNILIADEATASLMQVRQIVFHILPILFFFCANRFGSGIPACENLDKRQVDEMRLCMHTGRSGLSRTGVLLYVLASGKGGSHFGICGGR
jgi:hypothetical protein